MALIALSEGARNYVSEVEDSVTPSLNEKDVMMKEMLGEQKHAGRIVASLKSGLKIADASKELGQGEWWDKGQVCDLRSMLAEFV